MARSSAEDFDGGVPVAWFELARKLARGTSGFTPPVVSRAFAYLGLCLYEAVVPGSPGYRSLQGALPGLGPLPSGGDLNWAAVANAALAEMTRSLFGNASDASKAAVDRLESTLARRVGGGPAGSARTAARRGHEVARRVFDWSKTDGGHEAYLRNFPPGYILPIGPGLWVPTPPGLQPPLLPTWGQNRPFVIASAAACPPGNPTGYSEDPASPCYAEAGEVYDAVNGLTPEQEAIAWYWADDPAVTATPAGHAVSIATQVLRQENASLMRAAETYAKVGMAIADAFIACWATKYQYNYLRPVTYINARMDARWLPLLTTPPFPEYTSGHSVQTAAAMQVLTDLFGEPYPFDDHAHNERGMMPRHFDSFGQAADEAALSRLYGGIHLRPAIERGLEQGRCIGRAVSALTVRRGG